MKDERKTKRQLTDELILLRQQLTKLEESVKGQKRVEAALKQAEKGYRNIVENAVEGIYQTTPEGRFLMTNPAFSRIIGYDSAEEVITTIQDTAQQLWVCPEERKEYLWQLETHGVVQGFESQFSRKDKSQVWVSITARSVRGPDGKILYTEGAVEDITDRKRAEEELQHAKEKLEVWIEELERRNSEVNLLRQTGDFLQTCNTLNEAYTVIGEFVPQLFCVTAGGVYAFKDSRRVVESVITWGQNLHSADFFPPEDCWALRRAQIHGAMPSNSGLKCQHVGSSIPYDYLCVPMIAGGEMMGLMHIEFQEPGKNNNRTQELASIVAEHLSLSLTNLKLRESLRAQSIRDPLTELFNRRFMEESLERELHQAARTQKPVSIIMLDIDHFKHLNDTYGHDAGDEVLKELGKLIKRHIRGGDIACRFGGEEFILILPNASLELAKKRAEDIRKMVESLNLEYDHQPVGMVTVSLGIATYPNHGANMEAVLRKADEALYQAKDSGRNRVEMATIKQ
jgi:diguanylate cyclase (GGDEF)-like protein/PAS domain S-box-containing protein